MNNVFVFYFNILNVVVLKDYLFIIAMYCLITSKNYWCNSTTNKKMKISYC